MNKLKKRVKEVEEGSINKKCYSFYVRGGKRFLRKHKKEVPYGMTLMEVVSKEIHQTEEEAVERERYLLQHIVLKTSMIECLREELEREEKEYKGLSHKRIEKKYEGMTMRKKKKVRRGSEDDPVSRKGGK